MKHVNNFENFSNINEAKTKKETKKDLKTVDGFFNKLVKVLDKKYFPDLKFYRDDKKCTAVHYAAEQFNNGVMGYDTLIKKLAKSCGAEESAIHKIVKKYISDFGDYDGKFKA